MTWAHHRGYSRAVFSIRLEFAFATFRLTGMEFLWERWSSWWDDGWLSSRHRRHLSPTPHRLWSLGCAPLFRPIQAACCPEWESHQTIHCFLHSDFTTLGHAVALHLRPHSFESSMTSKRMTQGSSDWTGSWERLPPQTFFALQHHLLPLLDYGHGSTLRWQPPRLQAVSTHLSSNWGDWRQIDSCYAFD